MTEVGEPRHTVEWTIEVDDIVAAVRIVQRTARIAITIFGLVALAVGILLTAAYWPDVVAGVILNIPIYIAGGYLLLYGATRVIDRVLLRRAAGSIIGVREVVRLDEQSMTSEYPGVSTRIEWPRISSVLENGSIIVFRVEKLVLAWVPARAFASDDARREFVAFARKKVNDSLAPGGSPPFPPL